MSEFAAILERFEEANLELLEKRALLRRVDSKFLLPQSELAPTLSKVVGDYGIVLAGDSRLATYRTIYYDTDEKRCFHDHRRGRRPRQKIRVRHYDERGVSYLEIKTKRSEYISFKKRRPLPYNESNLDAERRAFVSEHSRVDAADLVEAAHTDFRRATLVGFHTNERITLDIDLVVSEPDVDAIELGGIAILEVKQPRFSIGTPIMTALRDRGHRPASASKYCTATALLRPDLRTNRLLPALRAIERLRQ